MWSTTTHSAVALGRPAIPTLVCALMLSIQEHAAHPASPACKIFSLAQRMCCVTPIARLSIVPKISRYKMPEGLR